MTTLHLIKKELKLELRRKAVLSGIILYLVCLAFICFITFNLEHDTISPATWSVLFWLIILFAVINSVSKTFIGERKGVFIYYYSLVSPYSLILSKIIYNAVLCSVLSFTGYFLFSLFIGNPVADNLLFSTGVFLTSLGFATTLTFVSGIASKANNSNVLMAVLSFPIIIGILLLAIKITKNALDGIDRSASYDEILNLIAINCILTALAYLLFPYVWRS